jgi:hypothetical protein
MARMRIVEFSIFIEEEMGENEMEKNPSEPHPTCISSN